MEKKQQQLKSISCSLKFRHVHRLFFHLIICLFLFKDACIMPKCVAHFLVCVREEKKGRRLEKLKKNFNKMRSAHNLERRFEDWLWDFQRHKVQTDNEHNKRLFMLGVPMIAVSHRHHHLRRRCHRCTSFTQNHSFSFLLSDGKLTKRMFFFCSFCWHFFCNA